MRQLLLLLPLLLLLACSVATKPPAPPTTFREKVEAAHRRTAFLDQEAIRFDLVLNFGGSERFNGPITLSTDTYRGLFGYPDSSRVYFEGQQLYQDVDTTVRRHSRFGAYTWSYFFALPYKLSDAGTRFADYPDKNLGGESYAVEKLSFDAGTGDAPDDWYLLYADPETLLLETAAYIVTAGRSQAEAEKSPSAIRYSDYRPVADIPIAHRWEFYKWNAETGLSDTRRGFATLSNVRFIESTAAFPDSLDDWILVE